MTTPVDLRAIRHRAVRGMPAGLVVGLVVGLVATLLVAQPARAERTFGDGPTSEVVQAARQYRDDCSTVANRLGVNQLIAMVLAPTFPETGAPPDRSPAPMTMSRYDTSPALYSFSDPDTFRDAFWHPGIGPWQWDDASLRGFTSFDRIDSRTIADYTTAYIASRWCDQPGFDRIWSIWNGCAGGRCKDIYDELLRDGVAREAAVRVLGGMQAHTCTSGSTETFRCWFVDTDLAQGHRGFAQPGFGPSPITAPFLSFRDSGVEHRHWLRADTGYDVDIQASLRLGLNSRSGSLVWERGSQLCDLTRGLGLCDPLPPTGFDLVTANVNGTYVPIVADFDGDGPADIFWYAAGRDSDSIWSGRPDRDFRVRSASVQGTYQPLAGDFDGDGRGDVLWYGPGSDQDAIWYGRADGGFDHGSVRVNGTYRPVVGDFDADGRDDVFWYAPGSAPDSQWYGRTDRRWGHGRIQVRGDYQPFVGDVNAAGGDDIIWYGPGSGPDSRWLSRGDRTFRSVDMTVNGVYEPIAADLDDDGRDDIVWYAPGTSADYLWTSAGNGFRSDPLRINGDFVLAAGDFDAANGDDVLFHRPGLDYDAIWWQAG